VRNRLDDMPLLTVGRYLRYLLRLSSLPRHTDDQPPRPTLPDEQESAQMTSTEPVPASVSDDREWWEQTRDT
jgi:hypothetical protein